VDGWYDELDGTGLAAAIRAGEVSAVEAVDAAITRIEAIDPLVHALVAERFDAAREDAAGPLGDGPFAGVPYLVKALGAQVTGLPTSRGSRLWADDVATADSLAVARARAAGVIVLGMTNTPELGKNGSTEPLFHGPTHNPHDLSRSAGGSSGGSAAAVASGMVPIAHGNDGGGSIRIPSAACGLFGLKPSRGRVPNTPFLEAFSYPVGCTHSLTRTVRDQTCGSCVAMCARSAMRIVACSWRSEWTRASVSSVCNGGIVRRQRVRGVVGSLRAHDVRFSPPFSSPALGGAKSSRCTT